MRRFVPGPEGTAKWQLLQVCGGLDVVDRARFAKSLCPLTGLPPNTETGRERSRFCRGLGWYRMLLTNSVYRFMSELESGVPPISELNAGLNAAKSGFSPLQW